MKKFITTTVCLITVIANACPVCERQQPKFLRGIVHGQGPNGLADYIIVTSIGIVTVITLYLSVKYLCKPGEKQSNHIKHSILNHE